MSWNVKVDDASRQKMHEQRKRYLLIVVSVVRRRGPTQIE